MLEKTPATLLKESHRCFPVNTAKFLRQCFLIERLWWLSLTIISFTDTFYFSENLKVENSSTDNSGQNFIGKIALNVLKT